MPYMFILPESIRWLILNGDMDKARKEIKRGARFNGLHVVDFDKKIDKFLTTKKLDVSPHAILISILLRSIEMNLSITSLTFLIFPLSFNEL